MACGRGQVAASERGALASAWACVEEALPDPAALALACALGAAADVSAARALRLNGGGRVCFVLATLEYLGL